MWFLNGFKCMTGALKAHVVYHTCRNSADVTVMNPFLSYRGCFSQHFPVSAGSPAYLLKSAALSYGGLEFTKRCYYMMWTWLDSVSYINVITSTFWGWFERFLVQAQFVVLNVLFNTKILHLTSVLVYVCVFSQPPWSIVIGSAAA